MLYQISDGSVSVGGQQILTHFHFEIKGKEKIAVVGRNGAGKTTLLRLIAGELELDRDDKRQQGAGIVSSRRITVGMLRQDGMEEQDKTVEELLLSACPDEDIYSWERFAYETEYDRLFTGFGFDKKEKKRLLSTFSGGERTKISLIRWLLVKPDILLLDEPTNHLDMKTVEWLEEYLQSYGKAVVFVSHDRFFLDQVADVVCELRDGRIYRYPGNYTQFRAQKRKEIAAGMKAYERQKQELARLDGLIERFRNKPKKAAFARSRKKIMDRMERIEKPDADDVHIFTGDIEPEIPGSKWVVTAEHLKPGYDKTLLELSLRVRRGQKIGVIGANGVGKSTFLKTVAGIQPPIDGKCTLGNRTVTGYFDQQSAEIQSDKTVLEHFHDQFPSLTEKEARQILGAYLFRGKSVQTKVSVLSGGEKSRLLLAELLQARPNLLILDEPTNHMDIQAKETLESAFQAYKGTILFVSHDRYFIRQVADAILVFEGKTAMYYPFGYEHYLEKSRKSQGEKLAALVQTEDQALISGIRAVPKGERRRVCEISTEDAYRDWRLRLAYEPMEEAKERVGQLWEAWIKQKEELERTEWELYVREIDPEPRTESGKLSAAARTERELDAAWDAWTERCLEWLDAWESSDE